jgi:hypothetical protein
MLLDTDDEIYLKRTTSKPEENTKKSNKNLIGEIVKQKKKTKREIKFYI